MIFDLLWPPRELHPNARVHYHAKSKAAALYRDHAYWTAKSASFDHDLTGELRLTCEFFPPDNRRRDTDGMLSAAKWGLDAIADAIGVNDRQFNPIQIYRRESIRGGRVRVTVEAGE